MLPHVFSRVTDFTDTDLTFVVMTYHDADPLHWMLGHLRAHYPGARVVVCSDGDDDPRLPGIAARHEAEIHAGEHLFAHDRGPAICQRLMDLFFQKPSRYFFKIDTDTGIHRRFHYLPGHDGLFGTLQGNSTLISVQGGFIGMTRRVMECFREADAFRDPSLWTPEATWARNTHLYHYAVGKGIVCEDWIFGYAATSLGLPMFGFEEVMSDWKRYIPNPSARFAVTHPCKGMTL